MSSIFDMIGAALLSCRHPSTPFGQTPFSSPPPLPPYTFSPVCTLYIYFASNSSVFCSSPSAPQFNPFRNRTQKILPFRNVPLFFFLYSPSKKKLKRKEVLPIEIPASRNFFSSDLVEHIHQSNSDIYVQFFNILVIIDPQRKKKKKKKHTEKPVPDKKN
jgi:hypothetical protein